MPEQAQEQELDVNGNPIVKEEQPTIDWEAEDNPYKKRYGESQSQVTPLVNTLKSFAEYDHNTKSWKPKKQEVSRETQEEDNLDFDKLFAGYDPEFTGNLKRAFAPIQEKLSRYEKQEKEKEFVSNYNEGVKSSRNKALEKFGNEYELSKDGKNFNPASPLYKLADEILTKEYCLFNPDGSFHRFTVPNAEYLAIADAYATIEQKLKKDPNFLRVILKFMAWGNFSYRFISNRLS